MIDAPLRPSTGGNIGTPSKDPIIQVSTGEENRPNNVGDTNRRLSNKRPKPDIPSSVEENMSLAAPRPDKRIRSMECQDIAGSDCDTEVSSTVSARREWLKDFGKQHEKRFPRKDPIQSASAQSVPKYHSSPVAMRTPPKAPREHSISTATESAASNLVNRMMMSEPPKRGHAQPPYKPKTRRDEIQATNDGYASVAQLSQWLANDPTSTKKKKHVRRGKNIITKSRNFEKDMENVIVIETNLPRGAVQDRKKCIQGAFTEEKGFQQKNRIPRYAMSEAGAGHYASSISVSDKKSWLKKAFKTALEDDGPKAEDEEARSEIILNDAASSLSVSDKKDWLKNAFKKEAEGIPSKKFGYNKAMTDVMHNRGDGDDTAARAKRRFLERSKRTATTSTPQPKQSMSTSPAVRTATKHESKQDAPVREEGTEERTGPPTDEGSVAEPTCQNQDGSVVEPKEESSLVDEEKTPVDFRAARQALLQRGKQNGHKMQVLNKVYMKKTKYENIEKEYRRRSGLLKPSWEEADASSDLPSTAYNKKFVSDIAPKKSFEELP